MSNSIFKNPLEELISEFPYDVVFLHGLEGSPLGSKAVHFRNKWGAKCPPLRTQQLLQLRLEYVNKPWSDISKKSIDKALETPFNDARDAINYKQPDIIIGSSMGGALLLKLIIDGCIDPGNTACVFLAPAIEEMINPGKNIPEICGSSWVLGEVDNIINNKSNISYCRQAKGNLIFSPDDGHRLSKALNGGLLDAAILTALECKEFPT